MIVAGVARVGQESMVGEDTWRRDRQTEAGSCGIHVEETANRNITVPNDPTGVEGPSTFLMLHGWATLHTFSVLVAPLFISTRSNGSVVDPTVTTLRTCGLHSAQITPDSRFEDCIFLPKILEFLTKGFSQI